MKKFSLFFLFAMLFFLAGCGSDNGPDYGKYDNVKSDGDADSSDLNRPDNDRTDSDTSDTTDDKTDTETDTEPDSGISENDDETGDDENQNDGDPSDQQDDFWTTCEGIIVCKNNCKSNDTACGNDCYGTGDDAAQTAYRGWSECFSENCAEDKTAECSAEKCAEWEDVCNVTDAFNYEFNIPAPYGDITFAGDFSFILNNRFPSTENEVMLKEFATGKISSQSLNNGQIISFVRTANDSKNGKMIEVYQIPYNLVSLVAGNPAVILRIKADSSVKGEHTVGVSGEKEAELIVADLDANHKIVCHHAFGIGTFTIDEAVIETGSAGRLKFSKGSAELFYPQNIPELGGDARETLDVTACPLIY